MNTYRERQIAFGKVSEHFIGNLSQRLNLTRVEAPLIVDPSSGHNDDLNGVERKVTFTAKDIPTQLEVVQSLAKWKRHALQKYEFQQGEGLYTDMLALRIDEDLDKTHALLVQQWDFELVVSQEDRTREFLYDKVRTIYSCIQDAQQCVFTEYPILKTKVPQLPSDIYFIGTQELENMYPHLDPEQREYEIVKTYGAVFIFQVGDKLDSGILHSGRAFDYDCWKLNGDILVWNDVLQDKLELSSMGIRVDANDMLDQARKRGVETELTSQYHKGILQGTLPYTFGGGFGRSRLLMYLLGMSHIGEVCPSVWPQDVVDSGIKLL